MIYQKCKYYKYCDHVRLKSSCDGCGASDERYWDHVNEVLKNAATYYDCRCGIILPKIKNVIFNDPATIVFWEDGTKTIVKCQDGDVFDPEKGLTMAISKKALGNKGNYCNELKKWLPEENDTDFYEPVFHIPDPAPDHIVKAMENMKKAAERFWASFKEEA